MSDTAPTGLTLNVIKASLTEIRCYSPGKYYVENLVDGVVGVTLFVAPPVGAPAPLELSIPIRSLSSELQADVESVSNRIMAEILGSSQLATVPRTPMSLELSDVEPLF